MPGRNLLNSSLLVLAMITIAGTQRVGGQEPLRCIPLSSIDRTEVIDDQTIAFYLSRDRIYLNHLNRACMNLERNRTFSYSTSTGQLCALDAITVIEDFGGLSRGASCSLTEFEPTDEETLAVMRGELEPLEIEPEELEVEEGDAEDSEREEGEALEDDGEGEGEGEGDADGDNAREGSAP